MTTETKENLNEAETKEAEEKSLDDLKQSETIVVPDPPPRPKIKIETLTDLKNVLTIARGGDPDAIQAVAQFMDMKSHIEGSYFPKEIISIVVAQLTGYGKTFFPPETNSWDPFTLVAECIAIGFKPYKGFKSNQFVDMTRQTPNLDALQTSSEETKQGVISLIFGRGTTE